MLNLNKLLEDTSPNLKTQPLTLKYIPHSPYKGNRTILSIPNLYPYIKTIKL